MSATVPVHEAERLAAVHELTEDAHRLVLSTIGENVLRRAGQYDGKYATGVALSTHLINAILIGLLVFLYDQRVLNDERVTERELQVLTAALALHDTDKFVTEEYGVDVERNTKEALATYFEEDAFGICDLLEDADTEYFTDLLYLIQRAETGEDASETRDIDTDYTHLVGYVELGDAVASALTVDGLQDGVERLDRHYTMLADSPVQTVSVTPLPQSLLHTHLLDGIKQTIRGQQADVAAHGVVVGSTPDTVVYLGDPIERETLQEAVVEYLRDRIKREYQFTCKTEWNSLEYEVLKTTSLLSVAEKRDQIATQYIDEVLQTGQGISGSDGFEAVPDGLHDVLPELLHTAYNTDEKTFAADDLNALWEWCDDQWNSQVTRVRFITELTKQFDEYATAARHHAHAVGPELAAVLTPAESDDDLLATAVTNAFTISPPPQITTSGEVCFFCGTPTTREYKPGQNALYQARGFSQRTVPPQKTKRVCDQCELECQLLAARCQMHDVSEDETIEFVYLYYDDFLCDVHLYDSFATSVTGVNTLPDATAAKELLGPQFHMVPVSLTNKNTSPTNQRLNIIHQVLDTIHEFGLQATLGEAFRPFQTPSAIFHDRNATARQHDFTLTELTTYAGVDRARTLLTAIAHLGEAAATDNTYCVVQSSDFHTLANTAVTELSAPHETEAIMTYFRRYCSREMAEMRTVAAAGIALYNKQYNSKHARSDIFRVALQATMSGIANGLGDAPFREAEPLREHVAGQVLAKAKRKQYAGQVETADAYQFVERVFAYLETHDIRTLEDLSQWENTLVNTYDLVFRDLVADDPTATDISAILTDADTTPLDDIPA